MYTTTTKIKKRAVHSWTPTRKCLRDPKKPLLAPYPLNNTSQFVRPARLNRLTRINDMTLTIQSLETLVFVIYSPPEIITSTNQAGQKEHLLPL